MEALIPDLYASAAQPLPFAPAMAMRSFLCRREHGNLLIYGTGGLEAEAPVIERIGGVSRHYESPAIAGLSARRPAFHGPVAAPRTARPAPGSGSARTPPQG